MKSIFYLLITTSFLLSCHKGKADFTLKGTVTDSTFDQPLSGGTLKLYEVEAGGSSQSLLGTTTLGTDGSYTFTFPRNKVETYIIEVSKGNYFGIHEVIPFSSLTIEDDNIRDLSTTAMSWAKITLLNVNPQAGDHLAITKQVGKDGCEDCCSTSQLDFYGAVDTSYYCANDGNTLYKFLYQVVGTGLQGFKSATTVAFDTTEIVLQY